MSLIQQRRQFFLNKLEEIENSKVPKGHVTLVGFGRLGLRTGINLTQIHRGGPKKIVVIDAQKISDGDIIFKMKGGKIGDYKVDLLKEFKGIKDVFPVKEDITPENLDIVEGDVVSIQIAGGDTLETTAMIIKKAQEIGAKTISTAGVFGIGDEEIEVMDISEASTDNPIVRELNKYGINSNHKIITTGKFIEDDVPITPYVLDELANVTTKEILKSLNGWK